MIYHEYMDANSVIVDDDGNLTGIVDWEYVSTMPLWKACDVPEFLTRGQPRHSRPNPKTYTGEIDTKPSSVYEEYISDCERTQLLLVFLGEMRRIQPGWMEVYETSQLQRDLCYAICNCDNELIVRHIKGWIEDMASGRQNARSIRESK